MWEQKFGGRRVDQGCEAGSGRGKSGRGLEEGSGFADGIWRKMNSIKMCFLKKMMMTMVRFLMMMYMGHVEA